MIKPEIEKNIFVLKQIGNRHPEILAIYLFGSQAKKKTGPLSDIDLGIMLTKEIKLDKQLRLEAKICQLLKTDKIDIVFFNKIPLEIKYYIIKDGICLYTKDKSKLSEIEAEILNLYLDMKYYDDIYYKHRLKQIGA